MNEDTLSLPSPHVLTEQEELTALASSSAAMGARFMDQEEPGWFKTIDLTRLYMFDGCSCILGQKFGSFESGTAILGLSLNKTEVFGFTCPIYIDVKKVMAYYWLLDGAWAQEIESRRQKAA